MVTNLAIIGLGGIGSHLARPLARFLRSQQESALLTLVDGDRFDMGNLSRQDVMRTGDNKAEHLCREIYSLTNDRLALNALPFYVTPDNIGDLLGQTKVVFSCVDNHKTRKAIFDWATHQYDIVVISGGNEYTDGNVIVYQRQDGEELTPLPYCFHPEIQTPKDKSPDEMSCEELAHSEPQLIFTNLMVASLMLAAFYSLRTGTPSSRIGEVYFDLCQVAAKPVECRPLVAA